jgi:hypothetical protein
LICSLRERELIVRFANGWLTEPKARQGRPAAAPYGAKARRMDVRAGD